MLQNHLKNEKVELECLDSEENTALSEASCKGHLEIVQFLLSQDCNPNTVNRQKRTPLSRAAFNGHIEVIKALLEWGGDPRITNAMGEAPFDVALNEETRQFLNDWDIERTDALVKSVNESKLVYRSQIGWCSENSFACS